ncbi:MAG: chemotaxis protein CheA [Clostridiales bacterium]|jgi:two-component system chemotaxis sensor kinase CheA|nr:chemotaxis protein CheA [Clostridiales bacterium]
MSDQYTNEPMLDIYIFEISHLVEQLEGIVLNCEKSGLYSSEAINEIFRVMHTIKGSSAMMLFNGIANLAHSIEDLFFFMREKKPTNIDCSALTDLVFESVDFIKLELEKIKNGDNVDGDAATVVAKIKTYISLLRSNNAMISNEKDTDQEVSTAQYCISQSSLDKQCYKYYFKAEIFFDDGCEMENIRAYTIVHNLSRITNDIKYVPTDIIENDKTIEQIRKQGFVIYFRANQTYKEMHEFFMDSLFLKDLVLRELQEDEEWPEEDIIQEETNSNIALPNVSLNQGATSQGLISVPVAKMDKLMDLVGEMVIAEAMVTQNPDIKALNLDNFNKAARQLRKITSELQDMVMDIRMVPLSATFHKMHRIARDMNKKLKKEVYLEIIGEETEVDKNIIEHISDPIMHLVRNAIDHGIETSEDREASGKSKLGKVTLEAKNAGNDVVILIKDDGKGLNKQKILEKARQNGLLNKPEDEMNDKEIFNLIFLPGFSTNDSVTEFSGRGVGMDVVVKNIERVGGSVSVESVIGMGTTMMMKIPLTLAIVDGMNISVGKSCYTIPTIAIKQSFRPKETDIITDPDGNEMIMVRGACYPILRLHQLYKVKDVQELIHEGILIMVENEGKIICLFADELIGEQQVVVKTLPDYIKKIRKIRGLSGCTLLGDGSISLILDVGGLIKVNNL